jgi:OOP family OmpA-OmpF porin
MSKRSIIGIQGALLAAAGLLVLTGCGPKQYNVTYSPMAIKVVKRIKPKKKVVKKIEITDRVQFKKNSAKLRDASLPVLDQVVEVMAKNPGIRLVQIQGHTDSKGAAKRNKRLSQRRAESVRQYLMSKGVEAERLEAKGFGEEEPLVDNTTRENRRKNRRVEFEIVEQGPAKTMAKGG